MTDILFLGRFLMFLGSAALAISFSLSMMLTSARLLLWSEALLALVFSFHAFTVMVAILAHSPAAPQIRYFVLADGAVHIGTALVAIGVLWRARKT